MAVFVSNLIIHTGTDFEQTFLLANEIDERRLILSGYSVVSKMKRYPKSSTSISFTCSITDANAGRVRLSLTSAETAALKPGRYYYDVVITDSSSKKTRVVEGEVFVKKAVTR
jgi:hypothetical protein